MTRVRADDYDEKSRAILDNAAALFAKVGYPGTKLQDVARLCGATKSMLYHYFPTKDDLLLALLTEHLERMLGEIEDVLSQSGSAEDRFSMFVFVYVQKSTRSRQRHVSAMNDIKFLPVEMQVSLIELERAVIVKVSDLLRQLRPDLDHPLLKPYTMLLLGMLNWTDLWFNPEGALSSNELCTRITSLFLGGFRPAKDMRCACPSS